MKKQLVKTSGADVLSSREKLRKTSGGGGPPPPPPLVLPKVKKLFDKVYLVSARWRENLIKLLFGLIQLFVSMRPKFVVRPSLALRIQATGRC